MADVADYERRFRDAGLPLFIEGYAAATDAFTRAAPLLALVFLGETLGAIQLDWPVGANLAAIAGGLAILVIAFAVANVARGRPATAFPERIDRLELAVFVIVPGLLPMVFGGQVESGLVTMAANLVLVVLIALLAYGLVAIVRGP